MHSSISAEPCASYYRNSEISTLALAVGGSDIFFLYLSAILTLNSFDLSVDDLFMLNVESLYD